MTRGHSTRIHNPGKSFDKLDECGGSKTASGSAGKTATLQLRYRSHGSAVSSRELALPLNERLPMRWLPGATDSVD